MQTDTKSKTKLIIIAGPTAIGKSKVAVDLALRYNGEIVSADSMQIYRGMDIGTGKISADEKSGINHYMLDIAQPWEEYSAGEYVRGASQAVSTIASKNKLPIIAGGTGLYISALLHGHSFAGTPKNLEIRESLLKKEEKNPGCLYEQLKQCDPASAAAISLNDRKRIVRALEICLASGKTKSELVDCSQECAYDYLFILLSRDRAELYDAIEQRIDKMLGRGLVEEVKLLKKTIAKHVTHINDDSDYSGFCNTEGMCGDFIRNRQSMQAIGYKEVLDYLDNNISYDDMVLKLKQNTRRYAKRQITYFKNIKLDTHTIDIININEIYALVEAFLQKKLKNN